LLFFSTIALSTACDIASDRGSEGDTGRRPSAC